MTAIKIVGVPEHFNYPWHLCIKDGEFEQENIDLQWKDIPEGTGKMCQMLREGDTDVAIVLTEGIIKDIINGNPSKIVQLYVESPLIWGIHVAEKSNYHTLNDLKNTKIAISRLGSGSQLMAYINAKNQGWATDSLSFKIVNTIDGAVSALVEGAADYFLWERFTTKPLVDQKIFRKIADCPTPWPCFVIAVRNDILKNKPKTIAKILEIINKKTLNFKTIPHISSQLASGYNQKKDDIKEWLSLTEWSQKKLDETTLNRVQKELLELHLIDKTETIHFFGD